MPSDRSRRARARIETGPESRRHLGNAFHDGDGTGGWFIGQFLDPAEHGIRADSPFECKWRTCSTGDHHTSPARPGQSTTVAILVIGRLRLSFIDGDVLLTRPGDYAIWTDAPAHNWSAENDSTVITIRAPSPELGDNR